MKLYTDKVVKKYGKRTVVKGISVEVNKGEIVGLLGPNGAGKTTTFYMIVGFISPAEGCVYIAHRSITKLLMNKIAKKGIGYLP